MRNQASSKTKTEPKTQALRPKAGRPFVVHWSLKLILFWATVLAEVPDLGVELILLFRPVKSVPILISKSD